MYPNEQISDLVVREITNGQRFLMTLPFFFLLITILITRFRQLGVCRFFNGDWGIQVVQSVAILAGAELMRSGWVWLVMFFDSVGLDTRWAKDYAFLWLTFSSILTVWGLLCCLRVFSHWQWSPIWWVISGLVALSGPILLHIVATH